MKGLFWVIGLFLFHPLCSFGQLEAANWVTEIGTFKFGQQGYLGFSTTPTNWLGPIGGDEDNRPAPLVSNCEGKLLFYVADSSNIKRHLADTNGLMLLNGDSLNSSLTDVSLFAKVSRNEDLYLYFHVSSWTGLNYTRIERDPLSAQYIVTQKNIPIDSINGESCITKHANGRDHWLIGVNRQLRAYFVYHINDSGSITYHSSFRNERYAINGQAGKGLYISANGTRLVAEAAGNQIEFLQFDPATGILFSPVFLQPLQNPFNLTFVHVRRYILSPEGTKFYAVSPQGLGVYQYDLTVWDSASIQQSAQRIISTHSYFWDVTIAPDGALYFLGRNGLNSGTWGPPHFLNFSRIRYPELLYPACVFEDTAVQLPAVNLPNGRLRTIVMPRFPMYYFNPNRFSVVAKDVCLGDTARIRLYEYDNLNSVRWDFGDPTSPNNTDTVFAPVHFYSQPGIYTITAIADYCNKLDTLTKTIRVWGFPESPQLPDTTLCSGSSLPLSVPPQASNSIRWSNGDSLWSTSFNTGGWHWAELSNACFTTRDSFYITLHEPPQSGLLSDTNICEGSSFTLTPQPGNYTWQWQDGSTQPLTVTAAGTYALLMTNACGTFVHEVRVDYQQAPELNLKDTSRCEGQFYRIELPEVWQGSYQWTDGSSERIRILTDSGWYSAEINNPCGTASDQFYLSLVDCQCHMYLPTAFSPNGDGLNDELIIKTRCPLSSYQMEVYDRWGRQIFVSNNLNRGWDGTFQGQDVPNGSYPFIIRYTPEGRNPRVEKGVVSVLR